MPVVPDALRSEMAGPGVHKRGVPFDTFKDELGVLPKKMGKATAAMIFAARIVFAGSTEGGSARNFPQNRK